MSDNKCSSCKQSFKEGFIHRGFVLCEKCGEFQNSAYKSYREYIELEYQKVNKLFGRLNKCMFVAAALTFFSMATLFLEVWKFL
jgi:hypothetical protein